ncbi:MAG: efflux RND transporter periplasmic adaptor subunit [Paludibacteraceae bacterium]|jgi:RND family efflux transporter MFP subunit|nr:efflux RND transporter periplasmic adaptor subunit [Paludibacteraceae bacterium]
MKKFFLFAAAAIMLISCGKKEEETTEQQERIEPVEVTRLQTHEVERRITLSSNLQAYETVSISPSLTGKIEHIYVEIGDRVRRGDSIVRMDQQQYQTTRLTIANLRVEMARLDSLLTYGSATQQQRDQMELQLEQTKVNLKFLTTNTFNLSPITGVVTAKNYEDGELYSGQPIVVLAEVDRLKTLVAIPESYLPRIRKGMSLQLLSDVYPDRVFPASVEVVYPTIDAATHTFQAKVVVPNKEGLLRPGMYVQTTIGLGTDRVITAPYSTVLKLIGANDRYVFIHNKGRAQRVTVEMGDRFGDDVEISAPEIHDGVELITAGEARLVDSVRVEVKATH